MGSLEAERTNSGWAGRDVSWISSLYTYTLIRFLVKIPDGMAPDTCAGETVYSPLNHFGLMRTRLRGGILGLGGVWHMGMKIAEALDICTVISSSDKKKVEAMEHLGADEYLVISESYGMQKAADSVDYIIETVPVFHPLQPYLSLLKLNGKLILTGAINTTLQFVVPMVMLGVDRKSIPGSFIETMKETVEMLQFCKKKELTSMIKLGRWIMSTQLWRGSRRVMFHKGSAKKER